MTMPLRSVTCPDCGVTKSDFSLMAA